MAPLFEVFFNKNMARKKETIYDIVIDIIIRLLPFYVLWLLCLWFSSKYKFWEVVFLGFVVIGVFFLIMFYLKKKNRDMVNNLIKEINGASFKNDINDFISRYGKERGKCIWKYMDYGFDYNKMKIFIKTLKEKGLDIKDLNILRKILKHYINIKEEALIVGGFKIKQYKLSALSGEEFEILLIKLFESMGYVVKHLGGVGDQGGDLILSKDNQRILIQAKCYNNYSIGNNAVQQAVAAKKHYDCDRLVVIGTSSYTREAIQLAKSNDVQLIWKKELQALLVENLKESWI